MPRKLIKNTMDDAPHSRTYASTVRVQRLPFFAQLKQVFQDPRTAKIFGLILVAFGVFALASFICFFVTGAADSSIVEMARENRVAHRSEIHNKLGLPGATLSAFLVDGSFGLLSICLIVLLVCYGLKLLGVTHKPGWKLFFISAFWLVWGSVFLSFIQCQFHLDLFFRLGGSHGEWLNLWLTGYIHFWGMVIVLLLTLGIYCLVLDPDFIEHVREKWTALKAKITQKSHSEPDADIPSTPDSILSVEQGPVDIEISVSEPEPESSHPEELEVEIAQTQPELEPESEEEDIQSEEPESEEQTELEIMQTKEVELGEQSAEDRLRNLGPYDPRKDLEHYKFPTLDLLKVYDNETAPVIDQVEQQNNANKIVTSLRNFGIEIESIKATVGPTVTLYEVVPQAGTRVAKIQSLEADIMMSLSASGIRIIAPMPGKGTIGIEVPNEKKQIVSMHSVVASKRFQEDKKMRLPIALGRTITNEVFMFDLAKTPHLLVAGATGQGKSVAINAIITSLLYKKHPAEMKLVLVDPKRVEFVPYRALAHHYLAAMPGVDERDIIITDCQKVIDTLNSLVIEMENRYELLEDAGVRNLEDYNEKFINRRLNPDKLVADKFHHQFLPYIVIVIDEYGDFIMQAGKQVETPIARITQKARAVGMHMILATQRPSVNIVTGVIKANIPTRIALRTQSVVDSRTVLDAKGAEQLIGKGDLLYSGNGEMFRIQCAFVDTPEVDQIVEYVSEQQHYFEPYQLPEYVPEGQESDALQPGAVDMKRLDPMFADVARYVVSKQEGSTSRLQRAFEIGYNRAGKLSDQLEAAGIVGPNKGPKGRDVLIQDMATLEDLLAQLGA